MKIRETFIKLYIRLLQRLLNRAYEKEGLTDDVLELQVKINELRNKYNINETDEEFVQ